MDIDILINRHRLRRRWLKQHRYIFGKRMLPHCMKFLPTRR